MIVALVVACGLGLAAGLRTMTPPAAILLARHHLLAGLIVGVAAVGEWVVDLLPTTPARTTPGPLVARVASGAFVGWLAVGGTTTPMIAGGIVGAAGAMVGSLVGYRARMAAIDRFGALPAAVVEDLVSICLAMLAFVR
jgi:uncharacterized membrane protein